MKLVLISPLGDLSCDVAIMDFPYAVGRNCRDFDARVYCSGLFGAAISQVSSKHAVFTVEHNQIVLEDLGSTNGTTVNGRSITGAKRVIYPGDRVNFAGKLEFIIDVEYPPLELPAGKSFTLQPVDMQAGLDSFQLRALPLLIGRLSPVFRKYDGLMPPSSPPLANRHARIFFKDDKVYVADLGSPSSLYVQGTKVQSGRAQLAMGCDVKFTDFFHYTMVEMAPPSEPGPVSPASPPPGQETAPVPVDDDRTIYFDESTTFMSVVSESDFNTAMEADGCAPLDVAEKNSLLGRAKEWLLQPKVLVGAGLLFVLFIVVSFFYFGSDTRKITRLLEQHHYEQGLRLANARLATHSDDPEVEMLARKALAQGFLRPYIALMDSGQMQVLSSHLDQYQHVTTSYTHGNQIVNLCAYLYDVEQFSRSKRRPGRVDYYFDIDAVRDDVPRLVKQWRAKKYEYKMLLDELGVAEPAFLAIRNEFYTSLNHLQKIDSNELPAIIKLESQIKQYLGSGMIAKVESLLSRFETSYPQVEGDERWRDDLLKLKRMIALKNQGDVYEALSIAKGSPMTTALFLGIVEDWQSRNLPNEQVFAAVVASRSLWKAGQSRQAIAELEAVSGAAATGELVAETLSHYREVARLYQDVQMSGASSCQFLADLFAVLSSGDVYFQNQFQDQYATCGERARGDISQFLQHGNGLYLTYQQGGGITGIMRMDDMVTAQFKQQGTVLAQAYGASQQARKQARLFSLTLSAREMQIIGQIEKEYTKQRARLMENRALSPAVLQRKMAVITWQGGNKD